MELTPPPIESGWGQDAKRGPVIVWALWFEKVWNALSGTIAPLSWTPVATSLTIVTGATYTGSYTRVGNLVHFVISVATTGTTASTAGTTYFTLPVTAAENDVCTAVELTAFASRGNGVIAANTMRVYPPSWAATANTVVISGTVRTT
jgi:hypothetical protein